MTRYRALKDLTIKDKDIHGRPVTREYQKGQLVKLPKTYRQDDEFLHGINANRQTPLNGLAFAETYVERFFDEDRQEVFEEFTRNVLLPVRAEAKTTAEKEA